MSVALFLTVIADSVFYIISKESLEKYIYSNLATAVSSRRDHIETYLEMLEVSVSQLSKSVVLEDFLKIKDEKSSQQKQAFATALKRLKRTQEDNPEITEFLLMDVTGKVVASSDESSIGTDRSVDSIFLGGLKETYIKDVYYSELKKMPLIAVSVPFFDSQTGKLLGVIAARVRLDKLNAIVTDKTGLGNLGEIYIVNKYGYMITPSRFKEDAVLKQKVDSENMRLVRLHKGREYAANIEVMMKIFTNYRGMQVMGAHEYLPKMQWAILAEVDTKEAFWALAKIKLLFLAILFITPLAALVLGLLIGGLITDPLRRLQKVVQMIGSGNLDYEVAIDSNDEVGELSRAFHTMTDNLKKSTTSVDNLNKEITKRNKAEAMIAAQAQELDSALKNSLKSREVLSSLLDDNNQIRERLEQNIKELKASYSKLKEVQAQVVQSAKLASLGQLAGGVAHEINNPLTGVINNVQLIKMEAESAENFKFEDFKQLLDVVEASALRCKKITQSVLDFSHASKGVFSPLSLNEIVEKINVLISYELKLQNVIIQKDLQLDLPLILGDSQLLQQVIFNFVSNAKWAIQKKSLKEGGTITLKTQYNVEKKEVCISVSDTGVGIPEENLKNIFESFFSTKEVGEGTGLGLSLAHDIIHKHGGRIDVESQLGVGATFKVSFPIPQIFPVS